MGEGHGGAARTAGQQALADRQALPGLGVAQAVRRQAYVAGNQLRIEAGPGLLPATALVQGGGDRQQFDALFDQGGVGVRVPAVGADQHAQASCRRIQHLQALAATVVEVAQFVAGREHLALRLAERPAIGTEGQADVVQLAGAGTQLAVLDLGVGQDDGAGDHRHLEIMGEPAEQGLVVVGHVHRLHPEQGVGETLIAARGDPAARHLQWVARGHPVHRRGPVGSGVDLGLLAAGHQPGADMLGEHHHRALVEQALAAGIFQVGVEFQLQPFGALVVRREQFRLDRQQIAALAGLALDHADLAAQVGQVVAYRAAFGPAGVGGEEGDEDQEDQLAHAGLQGSPQGRGVASACQASLCIPISNLSFRIIERSGGAP